MMIYSEACGKVIDITLEYQTAPLLEMQEKLAEKAEEENQEGESSEVKTSEAKPEVESQKVESQQKTFRVSFSLMV